MISPKLSLVAASAPVMDVDGTLIIQLGLFLLLMLLLSRLLFKPWVQTLERREVEIDGALEQSRQMQKKADQQNENYAQRMVRIREESLELRAAARREVEAQRSKKLLQAKTDASQAFDQKRTEIHQEIATARENLQAQIDELAHRIAHQLLGRSV